MPHDTVESRVEVIHAWFAGSIRFPRLPPLVISCARHLYRDDSKSPDCLTGNLILETQYRGFLSFWRGEIGEVAGLLKTQQRSAESVFLEERKVKFLVRQCSFFRAFWQKFSLGVKAGFHEVLYSSL